MNIEFDIHAAEQASNTSEGRWLSDEGIAFVDGARWQFDRNMEEIERLKNYAVENLKTELEIERMRLAVCGVAALGYYKEPVLDKYKSASLSDVLQLQKIAADAQEQIISLKNDLSYSRTLIQEIQEANANCISLSLHESRMQNMERQLKEALQQLKKLS